MATKPTESAKARKSRQAKQTEKNEQAKPYATVQRIREAQGPRVLEAQLPISGDYYLLRRVDLIAYIRRGVWPQPVTASVRSLMIDGAQEWTGDGANIEKNQEAAVAIARAAVVVPPPELVEGKVTVEELDAETLKPMFVDEDPDEDQAILLGPNDDDCEGGVRLHPTDLNWIAVRVMMDLPGAVARFRGES